MAGSETNKQEFIEMALRARDEIKSLRDQIAYLQPKAEAYEYLTTVLRLVPDRRQQTMGEDLARMLNNRVAELTKENKPAAAEGYQEG